MTATETLKRKIELYSIELGSKKRELRRHEFLTNRGSVERNMYIVESGSLRIFVRSNSEEITLRFGYKGSWMTSFPSFLTGKPSDFYIQAIKKSRLSVIKKKDFYDFIKSSHENSELWIKMLEEFAVQQLDREIDVLTRSPLERYKRLLKRSPRVFQEIPNKHIASYLRMTPETLSRLKKP